MECTLNLPADIHGISEKVAQLHGQNLDDFVADALRFYLNHRTRSPNEQAAATFVELAHHLLAGMNEEGREHFARDAVEGLYEIVQPIIAAGADDEDDDEED